MMRAGRLTTEMKIASCSRYSNARIQVAELPRSEQREGAHGVLVIVPIIRKVVERFPLVPFRSLAMDRGEIVVNLLQQKDLGIRVLTLGIFTLAPVFTLHERTETESVLRPEHNHGVNVTSMSGERPRHKPVVSRYQHPRSVHRIIQAIARIYHHPALSISGAYPSDLLGKLGVVLPPTRLEFNPHFYARAIVKTTQCHPLLVVQDTTSEVDRSETRKGNRRNYVGVLAFRELGVPCDSDVHGRRRVIWVRHRDRSHAVGIEWFRLQAVVHRIGEDLRSALDTPPLYSCVFREAGS